MNAPIAPNLATTARPSARDNCGAAELSPDWLLECVGACPFRAEADHRIANHLSILANYVHLQSAALESDLVADPSAVRRFAQALQAQIRGVARLHRMLALQSGAGAVDLGAYLHEICAPFGGEQGGGAQIVEQYDAEVAVDPGAIFSIGQFVGEALINALKYGVARRMDGVVRISAKTRADGALGIEVQDNGCGLPDGVSPETNGGFGFKLMRAIARSLGATLDFRSSTAGFSVVLVLPLKDGALQSSAGGCP